MGYHFSWLLAERLALSAQWMLLGIPGIYVTVLLLWCFASGRNRVFRLTVPEDLSGWRWLSLWPLGLLPAWNLCCGSPAPWDISERMPLLIAAIAEEFFFRGALLSLWEWAHPKGAVLGSALLFAVYHLFSPGHSLLQLWCAFAAGICYGKVTLRTNSLLPAMLAHLAVNLTGSQTENVHGLWLCALLMLLWGIWGINGRKKDVPCDYT